MAAEVQPFAGDIGHSRPSPDTVWAAETVPMPLLPSSAYTRIAHSALRSWAQTWHCNPEICPQDLEAEWAIRLYAELGSNGISSCLGLWSPHSQVHPPGPEWPMSPTRGWTSTWLHHWAEVTMAVAWNRTPCVESPCLYRPCSSEQLLPACQLCGVREL